jgi:hypothetical protein
MTMRLSDPKQKLVLLFILNVAASIAHYADNVARFALYPDPPWLNPTRTDAFWFVMTPVGAASCWLFWRGRRRAGIVLSYAYASMSLLVLGHYLVLPPWEMPLSINALIIVEAAAAAWLMAFTRSLHASRAGAARRSPAL